MGIKNYTILISIVFIVLFMSADQQNKDPFPGLVPAPADIEYLNSETKILGDIATDYNADDTQLENIIGLALIDNPNQSLSLLIYLEGIFFLRIL